MRSTLAERLGAGVVIPAHPLALDAQGGVDLGSQRAVSRYHLDAGSDGLAVGVHTTQFELHDDRGLLRDVLEVSARVAAESDRAPILVAGLTGEIPQAVAEAELARTLGYEVALLSPWGMEQASEDTLLQRAEAVGEVLPTIGFYLQPAVGGFSLSRRFWQRLFDLESVVAVKTAPFDRYRTGDVMQVLLEHSRWDQVAVLTGNDDAIVHDLITPYRRVIDHTCREIRASGGLLGQWAVGTEAAVRLVNAVTESVRHGSVPMDLVAQAADLVEINAAVFDVDHDFAGCVPGVNEVLRQQGVLETANTLGSGTLSPGQADLIASVRCRFPELLDESFVAENATAWRS